MKDLKLPLGVRPLLKEPLGILVKGKDLEAAKKVKEIIKNKRVIVVGDVTLKNLLEVGVIPNLKILDFRIKRKDKKIVDIKDEIKVRNPPGTISRELQETIKSNINEDATILIDGEEDLAVLPCIVEAEKGSTILYGQPDEGIVVVEVTSKMKEKARRILEMMED